MFRSCEEDGMTSYLEKKGWYEVSLFNCFAIFFLNFNLSENKRMKRKQKKPKTKIRKIDSESGSNDQ